MKKSVAAAVAVLMLAGVLTACDTGTEDCEDDAVFQVLTLPDGTKPRPGKKPSTRKVSPAKPKSTSTPKKHKHHDYDDDDCDD